jgi:transposase
MRAVVHYLYVCASLRKVSYLYSVTKSTLARWLHEESRSADFTISKRGIAVKTHRASKFNVISRTIEEHVLEHPYSTVVELQQRVYQAHGLRPSRSTVYRSLKLCKLTHKRAQRSKVETELKDHPFYHRDDPYADVISVDECHFQESDSPRYGWSKVGERVHRRKPNQYKRVSLLMAVSKEDVVAAMLVKGSVKADTFIMFLKLLPECSRVILDNASIHKSKSVKSYCDRASIDLIYTPPYCPWYNPIEFVFSVVKRNFRRKRITSCSFIQDIKACILELKSQRGAFEHSLVTSFRDRDIILARLKAE